MVRGKFTLNSITTHAGDDAKRLVFCAVGDNGTPENQRFHKFTPSGTLEMRVDNPSALEQFELGKAYYLDFTPCPVA